MPRLATIWPTRAGASVRFLTLKSDSFTIGCHDFVTACFGASAKTERAQSTQTLIPRVLGAFAGGLGPRFSAPFVLAMAFRGGARA